MTKALTYAVLLLAMCAFGFGVYHAAAALRSDGTHVVKPNSTTAPALPFTMYMAQQGAIYRFRDGRFTQITNDDGWTEPAASPDGNELVAVMRRGNYSDLYLLSSNGRVIRQLTRNSARDAEANHWAFNPRFSADGTQVFYSYDFKNPYASYDVDLAVYALPVDGSGGAVQWTVPNAYTGGDVGPVPLKNGAVVYTKYSIDDKDQVHSQIWLTSAPGAAGRALTQPDENCAQPAVSDDERAIAMVCRHTQTQSADLVVAPLDLTNATIGSESVLVRGQLAATPVFAPDGKTIAFLAPVQAGGAFQLWTVPSVALASPPAARPVTQNLGLDSSGAPVWVR